LIRYLDEDVRIVKRRLAILILIMVLYVVGGGLFTLAVGASDIKAAVFTGAGWQALFKGGIESVSLVTKRLE
jgi:predicted phage tail protein